MKAVIQRVTKASVTITGDGRVVSSIGKGICVLLGISRKDTQRESEWMAKKILSLRIFENPDNGKAWDKSITDLGLEVLCVSQFTLCHIMKGNKPDFHDAMTSELSKPMYDEFLRIMRSQYKPEAIKDGEFGAFMQVHIQNDGPVTLLLESPQLPPLKQRKPQGGARPDKREGKGAAKKEDGGADEPDKGEKDGAEGTSEILTTDVSRLTYSSSDK